MIKLFFKVFEQSIILFKTSCWTEKRNKGNIAIGANINEPEQLQREDNFVKEWGLIFITRNDSSSIGSNTVAKF